MAPAEQALARVLPWLTGGLAVSVGLLAVPQPADPLFLVTVHLAGLVAFGLAVTAALTPLLDDRWFAGRSPRPAQLGAAVALVALTTGLVALVTLASSAALRYDPSLQFLQLLSALDIAWAAAAITFGARLRWGAPASVAAGIALGLFCIWAIWRYLAIVGFGPEGQWVVEAGALWRYVLPYDMIAATAAIIVLVTGVRHAQPTAHPRPQS